MSERCHVRTLLCQFLDWGAVAASLSLRCSASAGSKKGRGKTLETPDTAPIPPARTNSPNRGQVKDVPFSTYRITLHGIGAGAFSSPVKSMLANSRSLSRRWYASTTRTVPDLDRITIDCVWAPPLL